jgi:hypothetical protein
MTVSAVRVPLVQILIEDFATMTVGTAIIGSIGFEVVAESGMSISAIRKQSAAMVFAGVSSMVVAANLKWVPEGDTPETWEAIADTGETWTPVSDTTETWEAIGDTSETWTPIADNSENWQIAA